LYLVLYSRLTDLVQGFPCPLLADEETESIPVPDPFILENPKNPKAADVSSTENMYTHYSKFVFRQVRHTPADATRNRYNSDMTLIKLFWADLSLAVHETLFQGPDYHWGRDQEGVLLESGSILQIAKHFIHGNDTKIDDEEFIVNDWDESATSRLTLRQAAPRVSAMDSSHDRDQDLQWTIDWTSVYARVMADLTTLTKPREPEGTQLTVDHIIETLENDGRGASDDFHASETM